MLAAGREQSGRTSSGSTGVTPRETGGRRWAVEVVDEQGLRREDRRAVGELLAAAFDYAGYREDGHRGVVPEFRVLVRGRGGRLLGQRSAFRLENDRGLVAYGLGDAAVHPPARRRGIGAALVEAGIEEARRRGAQAILTYTEPLAGHYRRRGFRPAGDMIAAPDLPEHRQMALLWMADGLAAPSACDPLWIEPGDF